MKIPKPVLFCDFDGVLCHDRYWRSLPPEDFIKVQEFLFSKKNSYVSDWMRGKYTAEEINRLFAANLGFDYEDLWKRFVEDCKTMNISASTLQRIRNLRSRYTLILMTSNMDSFDRFTIPALKLDKYFDAICNSYNEGILKSDNGGELYKKYISLHNAPISSSIVIDDSAHVGEIAKKIGYVTHLVTREKTIDIILQNI